MRSSLSESANSGSLALLVYQRDDHIRLVQRQGMSVTLGKHSTHSGAVTLSDTDRTEHAYIIGKTGSGKSTLMERMAIQDIQRGANVVYLDPHGSSAQKLLEYIPRERIDDVVYFNPADKHHIFQLNPLKKGLTDDLGKVAGSVLQAFKSIWWESWSDSLMQKTFLAGIHTVLATPEPTLLGLHRVYTDEDWRRAIYLHNPVLRRSWEFMDNLKKYERTQMMSSVVTRIEQFLIDPSMQRIFCSYRPKFSFSDIFTKPRILIVNLNKGQIDELSVRILGAFIISQIYFHAMQRETIAPTVYCYIDEFQNFIAGDIDKILSESRKKKLSLTMAHQYIDQIKDIRKAVFGNCACLIAFRVGADDAHYLKDEFKTTVDNLTGDVLNQYECHIKHPNHGSPEEFKIKTEETIAETYNRSVDIIEISRFKYGAPRHEVERMIGEFYGI